jgi:hypothetical protein
MGHNGGGLDHIKEAIGAGLQRAGLDSHVPEVVDMRLSSVFSQSIAGSSPCVQARSCVWRSYGWWHCSHFLRVKHVPPSPTTTRVPRPSTILCELTPSSCLGVGFRFSCRTRRRPRRARKEITNLIHENPSWCVWLSGFLFKIGGRSMAGNHV